MQRKIKNVVKNYTPSEIKVREATSNDPWGPSSILMSEIATLTFDPLAITEMMPIIWKRLNDHGKNWRHVYKSLVLLEYLVRTGSERVVRKCKDNVIHIQTLRDFQYVENGLDCGLNVREAAKSLYELLRDDEKLKSERSRAAGSKARFGDIRSYPSPDGELGVSSNTYNTERKYRPFMTDSVELERHSTHDRRHSPNTTHSSRARQAAGKDPEVESARPSNQNEEELQLQLALAMSKEEHEAEMKKRKGEEIKLQMAIEESKKTAQQEKMWRKPNSFLAEQERKPENCLSSSSSDLLGSSLVDPWMVPSSISKDSNSRDPWKANHDEAGGYSKSSEDLFSTLSYSAAQRPVVSSNIVQTAPWEEVSAKFSQPPTSSLADDFLEISKRHSATSLGNTVQRKATVDDWFGSSNASTAPKLDNLLEDLWGDNPVASVSPQDGDDLLKLSTDEGQHQKIRIMKKITPEEFLGPNAKLVDFDELVSKPKQPDNWNPFSMTCPNKGPTVNPFVAKAQEEEKSKRVPLNQLQSSIGNPSSQMDQPFSFESSTFNQSQPSIVQANQLSSFSTPALALMYTPQPIAQNQSYNPFL